MKRLRGHRSTASHAFYRLSGCYKLPGGIAKYAGAPSFRRSTNSVSSAVRLACFFALAMKSECRGAKAAVAVEPRQRQSKDWLTDHTCPPSDPTSARARGRPVKRIPWKLFQIAPESIARVFADPHFETGDHEVVARRHDPWSRPQPPITLQAPRVLRLELTH